MSKEPVVTIRVNAKIKNRSQILRLLRNSGLVSRVDIAKELGLTRSAITIITKEMIEEGVIREALNNPINSCALPGPKKVYLEISPDFKFVFGVAVERKEVSIGLSNMHGSILGKRFYNLPDTKNITYLLRSIIFGCKEILEENCLSVKDVLAIGICLNESFFEGDMNKEDLYSEISSVIRKQIGIFVCFDEITNGLALAEMDFYRVHDLKGSLDRFLYINNEHNIVASLAIKNSVLGDYILNKVNFGDMVSNVNKNFLAKLDKLDSINKHSGVFYLKNIVEKIYCSDEDIKLYKKAAEKKMSVKELVLFDSNVELDSAIRSVFHDACEWIAFGIYNCSKVFNFEKIVFFGKIFENLNFLDCFNNSLKEYIPEELFEKVCISKINSSAIFLSGCAIAIKDVLVKYGGYNPTTIKNI